jgi:hypothetical protein
MTPARSAGLLLLLAAAFPLGVWGILLFVGNPECLSIWKQALDFIYFVFSTENSDRLLFVWLAVLPCCLIALALAYLCYPPRTKRGAAVLLALNIALAGIAAVFSPFHITFWVALPALLGWQCFRSTPPGAASEIGVQLV